ncbi:hypothetical protein [Hafnia paralvei]|nr:hypothetical protein [Hafnia paralvei]
MKTIKAEKATCVIIAMALLVSIGRLSLRHNPALRSCVPIESLACYAS